MMLLGLDITATKALDSNQVIISSGKEKLVITVDPAGKGGPQYILSKYDRGSYIVTAYGDLIQNEKRTMKNHG